MQFRLRYYQWHLLPLAGISADKLLWTIIPLVVLHKACDAVPGRLSSVPELELYEYPIWCLLPRSGNVTEMKPTDMKPTEMECACFRRPHPQHQHPRLRELR